MFLVKINKIKLFVWGMIIVLAVALFLFIKGQQDNLQLKRIIDRLTADSRVAEVVVTDVRYDPQLKKTFTTIKFIEYDTKLRPLKPRYFTFSGNIIQFQTLVIRFDDFYIKRSHPLKGKSAYLFMKAFFLNNHNSEVFPITEINEVPDGYAVQKAKNAFERRIWRRFWEYALSEKESRRIGIKNVQIEAPGTKFVPGFIYTLKIEHDGGLRIDAKPFSMPFEK